jgi:hypothetical protein
MIYKASHHFIIHPFFRFYSVWKTGSKFHKVYLNGTFTDKNLPVLLISNHFSWWDGFWAVYLNEKIFHRIFHFMMLEEQLKSHMFFNKTGGYSIKKGSRTIIETIDYTAQLLSDRKNLVLIFPQGEISSMHTRDISFENGIEHIIQKINGRIHIVFLVNIIDYFSSPKPGLYMYFMEYQGDDFTTAMLQREYNKFYSDCISENLKITDI